MCLCICVCVLLACLLVSLFDCLLACLSVCSFVCVDVCLCLCLFASHENPFRRGYVCKGPIFSYVIELICRYLDGSVHKGLADSFQSPRNLCSWVFELRGRHISVTLAKSRLIDVVFFNVP